MQTQVVPQPASYLNSAIKKIYGDDDDFIVLGLTGRTGSGCSTVAEILQTSGSKIRHSLLSGNDPKSNENRKEKILCRYFTSSWTPFFRIQVRSLITTFLLDSDVERAAEEFKHLLSTPEKIEEFKVLLNDIKVPYDKLGASTHTIIATEYYTKILPEKCDALRAVLGESGFVRLYQTIGKNIRLSGDAYNSNFVEGKFFTLAERINSVIKIIHEEQKIKNQRTFIVVDAIRNPLEALFFQDRYSSFYLMAVSAPEEDRIARLRSLKYSEEDIASTDFMEYSAQDLDDPNYYSVQDIQSCLQRADLYVSNPNVRAAVNEFQNLANQLIKFVSLIRRPGIITPSPIERCMQMAYTAKLNSGCISRQVGAVVTDSHFSVRSIGWNDAPYGQVPCNLRNREDLLSGHDSEAYSSFEKSDGSYLVHFTNSSLRYKNISSDGRNNSFCFKSEYNAHTKKDNQVHTRSLHAEENAFLQIAKYGLASIEGGVLFTTASPCELCAKKAYQLGISKIFYVDPYPGIAVKHILQGGSHNPELTLFSGAIGRAFHALYTPIVAYKDELAALSIS